MLATTVQKEVNQWRVGLHNGVSIAIGYMPIALTYGFIAKSTGLSFMETILMSVFVYAGASQYMALDMISKNIGMIEIVITTFIVNIRHFLMSASLNEKTEKAPLWKKAIYAFGITDETFSVAAVQKERLSAPYMFGLNIIAYLSWVIFSGFGYFVGRVLPEFFQEGMAVALYAMFIGLLVPSMKGNRKVLVLALIAGIFHTFFIASGLFSSGWAIVFATLISAVLVEGIVFLRQVREGKIDD